MRSRLIVFCVVLFCANFVQAQGFLQAKGKLIVNGKGEKIILRGMGLGGWMLQEGYMFRLSNIGQQHRIREKITDLVGLQKAAAFYTAWLDQHTTRKDIEALARWGFNSVRLPMHYRLYTLAVEEEPVAGKNTWLEEGFARTDSLLAWCAQNHIYLILDLHATPGGQGHDLPISDRYPERPSLWESAANREKMIALWQKLAQRYVDKTWIGGYDIINEPNWGFTDSTDKNGIKEKLNVPLRELMVSITEAIRAVDKNHIIIIEGNGFGNNYNGVLPQWDSNMVLSFHKYGNFNQAGAIRNFLDLRDRYNLPLWMGESGENSNTWFTEAVRLVESNDIGWAWWQEKKMGINNPVEVIMPEGYKQLLDYWSGKGPRPTEDEAWRTLQGLLHNISIDNNRYHPDVTDALFRQVYDPTAKPFKEVHLGKGPVTIQAVDFDLGPQRVAYYDRDTASYQYTPGVRTRGNRGSTYRNDGVDIEGGATPYVFNIEDSEWLQYTIYVDKPATYSINFTTASDSTAGCLSLLVDGKERVHELALPPTGSSTGWTATSLQTIHLDKGLHRLRIFAVRGGFNLQSFQFR
jgi:aryl-phospho-beta-D-glucosidase BglC (GH1 family)